MPSAIVGRSVGPGAFETAQIILLRNFGDAAAKDEQMPRENQSGRGHGPWILFHSWAAQAFPHIFYLYFFCVRHSQKARKET